MVRRINQHQTRPGVPFSQVNHPNTVLSGWQRAFEQPVFVPTTPTVRDNRFVLNRVPPAQAGISGIAWNRPFGAVAQRYRFRSTPKGSSAVSVIVSIAGSAWNQPYEQPAFTKTAQAVHGPGGAFSFRLANLPAPPFGWMTPLELPSTTKQTPQDRNYGWTYSNTANYLPAPQSLFFSWYRQISAVATRYRFSSTIKPGSIGATTAATPPLYAWTTSFDLPYPPTARVDLLPGPQTLQPIALPTPITGQGWQADFGTAANPYRRVDLLQDPFMAPPLAVVYVMASSSDDAPWAPFGTPAWRQPPIEFPTQFRIPISGSAWIPPLDQPPPLKASPSTDISFLINFNKSSAPIAGMAWQLPFDPVAISYHVDRFPTEFSFPPLKIVYLTAWQNPDPTLPPSMGVKAWLQPLTTQSFISFSVLPATVSGMAWQVSFELPAPPASRLNSGLLPAQFLVLRAAAAPAISWTSTWELPARPLVVDRASPAFVPPPFAQPSVSWANVWTLPPPVPVRDRSAFALNAPLTQAVTQPAFMTFAPWLVPAAQNTRQTQGEAFAVFARQSAPQSMLTFWQQELEKPRAKIPAQDTWTSSGWRTAVALAFGWRTTFDVPAFKSGVDAAHQEGNVQVERPIAPAASVSGISWMIGFEEPPPITGISYRMQQGGLPPYFISAAIIPVGTTQILSAPKLLRMLNVYRR